MLLDLYLFRIFSCDYLCLIFVREEKLARSIFFAYMELWI